MGKWSFLCYFLSFSVLAESKADWPMPMKTMYVGQVMIEQLEMAETTSGDTALHWDTTSWYGGDYHRVVVRSEGEKTFYGDQAWHLERTDISYSYLFSSFWSVQGGIGVKGQLSSDTTREHYGVISVTGLAPYWFEVDSSILINERGKIQWMSEVEYAFLLSQTSYLQPRITMTVNLSDDIDAGRVSGMDSLQIGLRYRREISREFAPYAGIYWQKQQTVQSVEDAWQRTTQTELNLVVGVQMWF